MKEGDIGGNEIVVDGFEKSPIAKNDSLSGGPICTFDGTVRKQGKISIVRPFEKVEEARGMFYDGRNILRRNEIIVRDVYPGVVEKMENLVKSCFS